MSKKVTINKALDAFYGKPNPALAEITLKVLDAIEKGGASFADVQLCRSMCEEALGK